MYFTEKFYELNKVKPDKETTQLKIMSKSNHYDCLILGAGISGLDVGYHLQKHSPWASFLILDRRENLGGTWDFFKYPGIRSDSDMFTFGWDF